MGGLPSSRLTRILQEKAELLKRQRHSSEQVLHAVEEQAERLNEVGVTIPELKERLSALEALARRADWELLETQANALVELIEKSGQAPFEERVQETLRRLDRLSRTGLTLPAPHRAFAEALRSPAAGEPWTASLAALVDLEKIVRASESEYSSTLRARVRALAEWAGDERERATALDGRLRATLESMREAEEPKVLEKVTELATSDLPKAVARRARAREGATALRAAAQDLGVTTEPIDSALVADGEALALDWPTSVERVEATSGQLAESLREKVASTIDSLRSTLESLREYGVDPAEPLVILGEVQGSVPSAGPTEIPKLLERARSATEEPVVSIVAGLLDVVRPKLVEARRLGRDASEVFAAMNRAREALRLRIYSEALAASQEAIDRVGGLTQDLDAARQEADSLGELLERLKGTRFDTTPFEERLDRVRGLLARLELEPARRLLTETLQSLGSQAATAFTERIASLERLLPMARERGFLPDGAEEQLRGVAAALEDGEIADARERLASVETRLRTAASPYVSRRVEELERGFEDIPDESLVTPVRRLLAEADVNLRVKADLPASLETLKRAEKEFTAVFAAHASSLVEMLEEERRTLEAMGGAGDEIQRQIDEVQQIFNMGDFVKASKASQEIRSRAHQQQLLRSEEAVSHAKLALVELGKMGVDAQSVRTTLDQAADASRAHRYAEAYRLAVATQESALRLKGKAQAILDELQSANLLIGELAKGGVVVEAYREKARLAQAAYQALDLEGAKDGLDILRALLRAEQANAEARRLLEESALLFEDAGRMSLPVEAFATRLADGRTALGEGRSVEALQGARALHLDLVELVKPVLFEHLRNVERDLDVARAVNLEISPIAELLGEARRRLALPVPAGVTELLDTARSRLVEVRGLHEHAERSVRRSSEALAEAELLHAAPPAARERLAEVERALKAHEYAKVIEGAAAVERETLQATYQHVSKSLAGFQGLVVRARRDGSDASVAENLLQQARQALEEGRPMEALQLAGRSESEVERVGLQLEIAQGSLRTVEEKLRESEEAGVRAPVAREKVDEARAAFGDRLYPIVLELAIDASDSLALARENHRRSREALDSADRQVKEGMVLGADMTEVVTLLDAARASHQGGEYPDAVRKARDTAERARWAVERLYAGALTDVRRLFDSARSAGIEDEAVGGGRTVEEIEEALKVSDWKRAAELLQRARDGATSGLNARYDARLAELEALYRDDPSPPSSSEATFRTDARSRASVEREQGNFGVALELLGGEAARLREVRRSALAARLVAFKDRLWIGEKLGLDTTPVMEVFSEAQLALDSGQLERVPGLVVDAEQRLVKLVAPRLEERARETQTELVFAKDGLHVAVDDVAEQLRAATERSRSGAVIEAARVVLEAGEELNRRKALHRELMNLHYLIDAALGRASERHLDTTEARKLLDESIRARATDYNSALEKARAALKLLQGSLAGTEPSSPTAFWPFRRPPSGGGP